MPSLASAPSVHATCLRILRARGYSLSQVFFDFEDQSPHRYRAEHGGFSFEAENPVELLGLTALYEYVRPTADEPRWWLVEGGDIESEILQSSREHALAMLREREPERWRRLVLGALGHADCNASADEILGISRRELERVRGDAFLLPR